MKMRTRMVGIALAGALIAGTLGAGSAFAAGGIALVLEKDSAKRSLTLDNDRKLHVTAATAIENEQGESVPFDDIRAARKYKGRHAITGAERIEYEASDATGHWVATRIVLKPVIGH